MGVRFVAVTAALLLPAAGCGSATNVSLRQVKAAFTGSGLRLECPGAPTHPIQHCDVVQGTSAYPQVTVFDSVGAATRYAIEGARPLIRYNAYARKNGYRGPGYTIIVAKNVVYAGERSAAASRVMASLKK
jgi:hypothetical protein